MENDVKRLLNILVIYQSLIRQNLIDSNYQKKGLKLSDEIDNLLNIHSSRGDLYSYDYKTLSRDIASIFHPDIFKPLKGIIDNPDAMLADTFGILDDISKLIKEKDHSNAKSFNYNYGTDTYSDFNNTNTNKNTTYEDDYYEKEDEYDNNNNNGIYNTYTVVDFIKERFNAIFKGIPANSNDYYKIKTRLEKTISSLNNQLDIINKGILVLSKEIDNNKINWKRETSDNEIDIIYQRSLSYLYRQMKELEEKYNKAILELKQDEEMFIPSIEQQFSLWQREANEYINKYNRCMYMYNLKKANNPNADLRKMEKQIKEMNADIIKKYSNSIKAYEDIKKLILSTNESYRNAENFTKKLYTKYQNACNRYNLYRDNPYRQKDTIRKGVNVRYFVAEKKILITLKGQKKQRTGLFNKLKKTEEKYNNFCFNYKAEYEESEKSK